MKRHGVFIFLVITLLPGVCARGQEEKLFRKIEVSEERYQKAMEGLDRQVLRDLNQALSQARKKSDPERVALIQEQMEIYKRKRTPPTEINFRQHLRSLIKARKKMEQTYRNAIQSFTKSGNDRAVKKVQASLEYFRIKARFFKGKQYAIGKWGVSWDEAQQKCQRLGGSLVIITNQAENDFLTRLLRTTNAKRWVYIGASDRRKEGKWQWVNGQKVIYSNWDLQNAQPNNRTWNRLPEHYAAINLERSGKWWDLPVEQDDTGFICQWE